MPQPHKGPRKAVTVRIPLDKFARVSAQAAAVGMTVQDYVQYAVERTLRNPPRRIQ